MVGLRVIRSTRAGSCLGRARARAAAVALRIRPCALNIHTGPPSWVASRLRRAALVYDAHELYGEMAGFGPLNRIFARFNMALERFMVRRSDAVITTNPSRAEILKERHGQRPIVVL